MRSVSSCVTFRESSEVRESIRVSWDVLHMVGGVTSEGGKVCELIDKTYTACLRRPSYRNTLRTGCECSGAFDLLLGQCLHASRP